MLAAFAIVALLLVVAAFVTLLFAGMAMHRWRDTALRRKRLRAAALSAGVVFVAAVAVVAIAIFTPTTSIVSERTAAQSDITTEGLLRFLTLRSGLNVYLDSPDDKAVLFNSLETTRRWAMGTFRDNGETDGPADLPHVDVPIGTRVSVDTWSSIPQLGDKAPLLVVKVREVNAPHRSGWANGVFLIPILPAGTTLVTRDLSGNQNAAHGSVMDIAGPTTKASRFVNLEPSTRVSLIDSRPNGAGEPYFVRVLSGTHRGQRGYFSNLNLGGPSLAINTTDDDYDPRCKCVSLYLKDPATLRTR